MPPASSPRPIAVRIAAQAAGPPSESAQTVGPRTKNGAKTKALRTPIPSTESQAQLRRRNSAQPSIRSESSDEDAAAGAASGRRRPTSRAALTRKLNASSAKAQPGLEAARTIAASAGPTTPPAEATIPRRAFASRSEPEGTTSGISAVIAGMKRAVPAPSTTSATRSCPKLAVPASSRSAIVPCPRKRTRSAPTSVARRESRSPIVPPTRRTKPKASAWQPSAMPACPIVPPIETTAKGRAASTMKLPASEARSAPSSRRSWDLRSAATFAAIGRHARCRRGSSSPAGARTA
jgi:hypothetical protein